MWKDTVQTIITDLSMVLLFPLSNHYQGSLNQLYKEKRELRGFRFFDYFKINFELLNYYKKLNRPVYILTSDMIQEAPDLQPYWQSNITRVFSAAQMGTSKQEPVTYEKVLQELNLSADQVIYIDDNEKNIAASQKVGLATILYQDNHQAISDIKRLLTSEN